MGVYIKGMEMPKKQTTFTVFPNGYVAVYDALDTFIGEARVIPVPSHGRLVDGDELFKEFERKAWYDNADRDIAEDILLDAPTVIPAEKETAE